MSITMNDVKHMDCEICGGRMEWMLYDGDTRVYVYCLENDHPEYIFDLEIE